MIKSEHFISVRSTFHANGICMSKNITVWIHKELLKSSQDTNILKKTNFQSTLNTVHRVHIHASGHRSHFMLLLPPPLNSSRSKNKCDAMFTSGRGRHPHARCLLSASLKGNFKV